MGTKKPRARLAAALGILALAAGASRAEDEASSILEATGVKGGLVVHLGCGDGKLTAALRASDGFIVQGLTTSDEDLRSARANIGSLGLYGPVTIARFDGKHLPYAANIVNLLVASSLGDVATEEAMRVLAPGGALCVKRNGRWARTLKPQPRDTDDWSHFLHDCGGNAVSRDTVVGPPRRVQWLADPPHARSHEHTPSIEAVVSAGGRIFYIADEGPIWSIRKPAQWRLVARDAYNGTLLWERQVVPWFPHIVNWGAFPRQLQRRLVATHDRLYVTLGYFAPVSAIEAATGKTIETYQGTEGTEEIVLHDGILLLVARAVTQDRTTGLTNWLRLEGEDNSPLYVREKAQPLLNRFRSTERKATTALLAVEAASGRILWKKTGEDAARMRSLSLCAAGDRAYYHNGAKAYCVELKTGRQHWSAAAPPVRLVHDGKLVCAGGGSAVSLLAAADGKTLWQSETPLANIRDVFIINGSLWLGGFPPYQKKVGRRVRGSAWGPYAAIQLDIKDGRSLKRLQAENPGHHHRCWQNKATVRYILAGRRGVEFYDLNSGKILWHNWVRGVCRYGIMPANGLLYAPSHACGCYITAKLDGFFALATDQPPPSGPEDRLEPGPAYSSRGSTAASPADWPTYRHDPTRSGHTEARVPPSLRRKWQTRVGGKPTAPTVADGKVFVASVDDHRVVALAADTGKTLWTYTAGGRVDSPPTFHRGLALFGSHDGCLYCLRASDGQLTWRLRTAGADRRVVVRGQLESPLPLHGSVLLSGGSVWFTVGRSSYLDGGIRLYRVEPTTGRVLSRTRLYSPDPRTGEQPKQYGPAAMPGELSDILVADAERVYLRETAFGPNGQRTKQTSPHLLTLTGFLDDTWPHRSYWVFGTKCSLSIGCAGRARDLIYGRLIVRNGQSVYGYGRRGVHWSNQLQDGSYRLFATRWGERTPSWERALPARARAMVLAGDTLFLAGPSGDGGATLVAVAASDGKERGRLRLDAAPVLDGMAAAPGRLYIAQEKGSLTCLEAGQP